MSRAVSKLLLNALLDDYSLIRRQCADGENAHGSGAVGAGFSHAAAGSVVVALSPAIGRRAVAADRWDGTLVGAPGEPDLPVLIHGPAAQALAVYRSAGVDAGGPWPPVGIDIAEDRERHCVESVHKSLAVLTDVPRTVPVTVGLQLEPGWRDALSLITARGRCVRFAVCGIGAPDAPALVDVLRTAVAEGCAFSWAAGAWQPVTDPWSGPLPGILNVLLAVAEAVRGASATTVAAQLSRTDQVDVVDAVCDLDDAIAGRIRALLGGFAVPRVRPVVDAFSALDLLPKAW